MICIYRRVNLHFQRTRNIKSSRREMQTEQIYKCHKLHS